MYALVLLLITVGFLVLLGLAFRSRPSWAQSAEQVTIREPGARQLGAPEDARRHAERCLDVARLSLLVYQGFDFRRLSDAEKRRAKLRFKKCEDALKRDGWKCWNHFLQRLDRKRSHGTGKHDMARAALTKANLYVEVWSREESGEVVVAFTGTYFTSLRDWASNLRWFLILRRWIPGYADQYMVVARTVGQAFVEEFEHLRGLQSGAFLKRATIISTGHSLGGGLAQHFAYSLPSVPDVPRVKYVYGFDPSPVTGYFSVGKQLRNSNSRLLEVERVYERGEALAFVRMILAWIIGLSSTRPRIRETRFSVCDSHNPFANHSILDLVDGIERLADRIPERTP